MRKKPAKEVTQKGSQCVGHQIVNIRCPVGKELQQFNHQGKSQSHNYGMEYGAEGQPKNGQEKAKGYKQKDIQQCIVKIGEHI